MKKYMYYKDAYRREMKTRVVDVIEEEDGKIKVELEDTCFYPEGGGQPSDIGTIDDVNCYYVKEENDIVYHYVDKELELGKEVVLKLDFRNRYENMKHHTAEHIVSGLEQIMLDFIWEKILLLWTLIKKYQKKCF